MRNMANLGKGLEEEVKMANEAYLQRGIALIQKVSTPWVVIRRGKKIVHAFPEGKSTLLMERREEKITDERIKKIERQFYEMQANKKIDKYG